MLKGGGCVSKQLFFIAFGKQRLNFRILVISIPVLHTLQRLINRLINRLNIFHLTFHSQSHERQIVSTSVRSRNADQQLALTWTLKPLTITMVPSLRHASCL